MCLCETNAVGSWIQSGLQYNTIQPHTIKAQTVDKRVSLKQQQQRQLKMDPEGSVQQEELKASEQDAQKKFSLQVRNQH